MVMLRSIPDTTEHDLASLPAWVLFGGLSQLSLQDVIVLFTPSTVATCAI